MVGVSGENVDGKAALQDDHTYDLTPDLESVSKPARSAMTICEETERNFQILLHTSKGKLPQGSTKFYYFTMIHIITS